MAFPLLAAKPFWKSLLPANASFSRSEFCKREIQTKTQPTSHANEDLENHETGTLKPDCNSVNAPSNINSIGSRTVREYSATSDLKTSPRHNIAMIFICNVCETRSVKTVCRESYEKGVVVARCGSIEEFLAAFGEEVKKGSIDTLNLTPDDLAGWKS
ncbi:dnl-type zinc finger protein [Fagus crenata]